MTTSASRLTLLFFDCSSSSRFRLLDPLGATPDSSLLASLLVKLMNMGPAGVVEDRRAEDLPPTLRTDAGCGLIVRGDLLRERTDEAVEPG